MQQVSRSEHKKHAKLSMKHARKFDKINYNLFKVMRMHETVVLDFKLSAGCSRANQRMRSPAISQRPPPYCGQ